MSVNLYTIGFRCLNERINISFTVEMCFFGDKMLSSATLSFLSAERFLLDKMNNPGGCVVI